MIVGFVRFAVVVGALLSHRLLCSRRANGRHEKQLGDMAVCLGNLQLGRQHYQTASKAQRDCSDWAWLASVCVLLTLITLFALLTTPVDDRGIGILHDGR